MHKRRPARTRTIAFVIACVLTPRSTHNKKGRANCPAFSYRTSQLFELEVGIVGHTVTHVYGCSEARTGKGLESLPIEKVVSVAIVDEARLGFCIHGDG